jgi:hypothetical protein
MPINPIPTSPQIVDLNRALLPVYQAYFASIGNWLGPVGLSGPTSQRPVPSTQKFMYIGLMYFDTSLGLPVFVKSLNPTVVWVNGAGVPV